MTARDIEIVELVYTHRGLTTPQIYDLVFSPDQPGPPRRAISRLRHRLKMLFHAGYLYRLVLPNERNDDNPHSFGNSPDLYMTDKNSIPLIAHRLGISPREVDWKPKHNKLQYQSISHLVACNDFRVNLEIAAKRYVLTVINWIDDLTFRSKPDDIPELAVADARRGMEWSRKIPDGYFRLNDGLNNFDHFFEIDMGTEPGNAIKSKADWYVAYCESQWHKDFYGCSPQELFVLFVTAKGPRRVENIRRIFEESGADDRFWFTTMSEAVPGAILDKPIWSVAGRSNRHTLITN